MTIEELKDIPFHFVAHMAMKHEQEAKPKATVVDMPKR